jgi:2-iminoacetate synthase
MFIKHDYINELLENAKNATTQEVQAVLDKSMMQEKLNHKDVAILLQIQEPEQLEKMFSIAGEIKNRIYGNRIVVFAPLYISDYCVNNCTYCGYKRDNTFERRKLSMAEIQEEVRLLEKMGHKRLALEVGEDPVNSPIEYVCDAIDAIYSTQNENGAIRRVNVNIAATTVENYEKLKDKKIGTYILFQETYHKPTYETVHPKSLKGNYDYHTTAFDRAMEAGIEDVGAGVLFGLYDWKFEILGLMLHNEHLEETHGVGFHTISVPRIKKAEGMELDAFDYLIDDETFKKIVTIIRVAVPFTGIILSTRESAEMRRTLIKQGVSQISAGSCTGVGGYKEEDSKTGNHVGQFNVADERTPLEILKELVSEGLIPSYCTACYRSGRTGDRFMQLAKTGQIHNVCTPNALMTLMEFILDYGDEELLETGKVFIKAESEKIERDDIKQLLKIKLEKIENGERDLFV